MSRRAARRTPQQQILISLAGPGAGFVLAALTAALVTALGGEFRLDCTDPPFFYARLTRVDAPRRCRS